MRATITNRLVNRDDVLTGAYWIKLEQEPYEEETITLGGTAELLDEIFGIDPCVETTEEEEETEVGETANEPKYTQEDFEELIRNAEKGFRMCNTTANSDFETYVRVYVSDFSKDYRFVLNNGTYEDVGRASEQVTETIAVNNAESVTLGIPPSGSGSYQWLTYISSTGGAPVISESGGVLSWEGECSGSIACSYPLTYDRKKVTVPGVGGGYSSCNTTAFYVGLVDSIELEQPDTPSEGQDLKDKYCGGERVVVEDPNHDVKCYYDVRYETRCQCSGRVTGNSYTSKQYATCPEGVRCQGGAETCELKLGNRVSYEYVDCGEVTGDINDPEFYEETCCDPPPFTLPDCATRRERNPGGKGLSAAKKQEYYDQYGEQFVKFQAISPEDGDCGDYIYRQNKVSRNCCGGVLTMVRDEENSSRYVAANEWGVAAILYGSGEYEWKLNPASGGRFGNGSRTITTTAKAVSFQVDIDYCGIINISVDDGCSKVYLLFYTGSGDWYPSTDYGDYPCPSEFSGLPVTAHNVVQYADYGYVPGGDTEYVKVAEQYSGEYKLVETMQVLTLNGGDNVGCCDDPPSNQAPHTTIRYGHFCSGVDCYTGCNQHLCDNYYSGQMWYQASSNTHYVTPDDTHRCFQYPDWAIPTDGRPGYPYSTTARKWGRCSDGTAVNEETGQIYNIRGGYFYRNNGGGRGTNLYKWRCL